MSRDHKKLRVFELADALVLNAYEATATFPMEERFGLQSQIRRAAVSTVANIVEGCARRTTSDYVHFFTISLGSASETKYLIEFAPHLKHLSDDVASDLSEKYDHLIRSLQRLTKSLSNERL